MVLIILSFSMFNSSKDANVPAVYLTTPSSMNIVTPFLCLSICPYGHRWPSHNARRATRLVCYSFRSIFHLCKKRRGRCPFKWSTWRVWPVINEYAVSHGSCKETSGSTGERGYKEGDILTSLENSWSMQGWQMAAQNMPLFEQEIKVICCTLI